MLLTKAKAIAIDLDLSMNFLGHLLLAGPNPEIRIGNFIADHIKGIPLTDFPPTVAQGIMMHRAIDYFTDTSPILREAKVLFRPYYRKYASVVLDVIMDHFIANEWTKYSPIQLESFIYRFYLQLVRYWSVLPPYWRERLPEFISDNRMLRYRSIYGICESLDIMARTTSLPDASSSVKLLIEEHYDKINGIVSTFIPSIVSSMSLQFDILPIGWTLPKAGAIELHQYK